MKDFDYDRDSSCVGSLELDMHNGSHSQKENRHVSHARGTDREREGRRSIGYELLMNDPKRNVLQRFFDYVSGALRSIVKAVQQVYQRWKKRGTATR